MKTKKILVAVLVCVALLTTLLFASCTPPPTKYTITFSTGEGSAVESQSVEAGAKVNEPEPPTREGYSFDGWFTDAPLTVEFDFSRTVYENLTVYAKWSPLEFDCTITYNSKGGTAIEPVLVPAGEVTAAPAEPALQGYIFQGWFTDEACTAAFTFGTKLSADVTLYAKWEKEPIPPAEYTVTFSSGESATTVAAQKIIENNLATRPADPTRKGYIFDGWYTSTSENAPAYVFTAPVTANITLYARWKVQTYTVSFESTSVQQQRNYQILRVLAVGYPDYVTGNKVAHGTRVYFTAAKLAGAGDTLVLAIMVNGKPALSAKCTDQTEQGIVTALALGLNDTYYYFEVDGGDVSITGVATFYVVFNANGGGWETVTGTNLTTSVFVINGACTLPENPVREGYTFAGWYNAAGDITEPSWGGVFTNKDISATKTVYARWTVKRYNVTSNWSIDGVTVEMLIAGGGTTQEYNKTVGLRIIDNRVGTNLVPLLIRINGVAMAGGVMDGAKDKTFTIVVKGETNITVTTEYRINVTINYAMNPHILGFYNEAAVQEKLISNGALGSLFTGAVFTNVTAGEKFEYYVQVAAGYSPSVLAAYQSTVTIEPARYLANIGLDIKKGDPVPNLYKVTYTPPTPFTASLTTTTGAIAADTIITYSIGGTDVKDSKYLIGQYSTIGAGGVITLNPLSGYITTYNVTSSREVKIVFVILDDTVNFRLYRKGYTTPVIDTSAAPIYVCEVDGVRYNAYIYTFTPSTTSPVNEEFSVKQYYSVSTYENNDIKTIAPYNYGDIWTTDLYTASGQVVMVNGVAISGTAVNSTHTRFSATITGKTRIDIYSVHGVSVSPPAGGREATVTAPSSVPYGQKLVFTVSFKTYSGFQSYVVINTTSRLVVLFPNSEGKYEFDTKLITPGQPIVISADYSDNNVLFSFDNGLTYKPVPIHLADRVVPQTITGKVFKEWKVYEYNALRADWAGNQYHNPNAYIRTLGTLVTFGIKTQDWIVASYDDITPNTTVVSNLAGSIYSINNITVDGLTTLVTETKNYNYKNELMAGYFKLGYSQTVRIEIVKAAGATDVAGKTLKVFVGSREIQPVATGIYEIKLPNYADTYTSATSPLVITVSYSTAHTSAADGGDRVLATVIANGYTEGVWATEYNRVSGYITTVNATSVHILLDSAIFESSRNLADASQLFTKFCYAAGRYEHGATYRLNGIVISNPASLYNETMLQMSISPTITTPGTHYRISVLTVTSASGITVNYIIYLAYTVPAPTAP